MPSRWREFAYRCCWPPLHSNSSREGTASWCGPATLLGARRQFRLGAGLRPATAVAQCLADLAFVMVKMLTQHSPCALGIAIQNRLVEFVVLMEQQIGVMSAPFFRRQDSNAVDELRLDLVKST